MARRIGRCIVVSGAAALLLVPASPAGAQDVGLEEFRTLARAAADDPEARARLRTIDSVDGRPIDVDGLLEGGGEEETKARLLTLSAPLPALENDASEARAEARAIVSGDRFRSGSLPRPLQGFLRRVGEWLRPVWDALSDFAEGLPGPRSLPWVLLALAVVIAATLAASRLASRRGLPAPPSRSHVPAIAEDPAALEEAAYIAERRGDFERAIRLRFRAGLLRLDAAGAIEFRSSTTTGEVARTLQSRTFDELARTFDSIVYGRRAPTPEDSTRIRTGWNELVATASG